MIFKGKTVIITGSSSGIGAECAILFAKEGANVAINGRNEAKLKNVCAKIQEYGITPLILKKDVTIKQEAKEIIEETVNKFGGIDVLVNNAGVGTFASITSANILEAYDENMNTNIRAVVYLTHIAAPYIIKTKGNIINISSIAGLSVRMPSFLPYAVSKAALDHFTRCVAAELAPKGVRVNVVNPGPVYTDIVENNGLPLEFDGASAAEFWESLKKVTALKRVSTVDETADLVVFLASDKARGITGSTFVTDNGALL